MNTLLETISSEVAAVMENIEEAATMIPAVEAAEVTTPANEQAFSNERLASEIEAQRWVWLFDQLKNTEVGLSFSDKVKVFCEASAPEDIEHLLFSKRLDESTIIPLAA